ncbi:extracellular solute-binding protein [Cellulosimicrobium sp. CUA-896]|uniref:extracellular solute-binding protein n=1 Tax=Cellulosimicrobium sp. CUA-896 TaxID=1517881 RepID=UPI000959B641|nr:extracellular solute-binding protein [Cellulosimicrobium sp. CUA-896]OLT53366.1 ABC transporter substrate-binding protein [Cellulosimicrobium sp. CUA-896]
MRRRTRPLAVLAVLGVAAPLAACATGEGGTPELTWYINPDAGGQATIAAACSDESGGAYRIVTELLPRDAASQREQLARRLAAKDSSIDLMSLDPVFIAEFAEAEFLAPVPDDVAEATTEDVVQGAIDGSTWKDELVAVPFWANTQLLWYRTSVAEAAGLDMSQPVSWEQIMEAASSQDKLLAVQGAKAESLTVWINALVEGGGGHVVENPEAPAEDIELGLESDAGREAAQIMGEIGTSGLGGPGLPSENESASLELFQGDDASFMVNWPFVWSSTQDAVESGALDQAVLDDIGWALYPQTVEGEDARPPYGGISLGVGAFGEHTELAYEAAECIVSPENQAAYFVTDGNPPASTEAYEDPEVQETFPMADLIRDSLEQAAPRPKTPFYNEVSTGLQQTWYPPSDVDPQTTPERSTDYITAVLRGERLL